MTRLLAAVFAALLSTPALSAQEPLTLDRAIEIATERGPQARAARAMRDAARFRGDLFHARQRPQLTLGGSMPSYNRSVIPVVQPDGTTLFRPQRQTNTELTMRLAQRLPFTGGELFVSSGLARLEVAGIQDAETWSSTPVAIGLRQELFRPNVTRWDAREETERSERDERAYLEALEDVALQVTELFFDVYAAQVALGNAVANAAVNDTLYRLNTGRYEVGRIGENDLLQSELVLLQAQTALDAARLNHERAEDALRLGLGLAPGTPVEVSVSAEVPDIRADTALAVAQALVNRAAVSDAALQGVQARRRVSEARWGGGPGATLNASFGLNAIAPEMDLAYRDLLEARRFSLSVDVPLWQSGARKAAMGAARADYDRVATQTTAALEQLAHEARFAALQLAQARRNLEIRAKAQEVAERRFEVAYNRYGIGRITLDNLYRAQSEKDQAVTQLVQALQGYWRAYYRLRRATLYDFETGRPIR